MIQNLLLIRLPLRCGLKEVKHGQTFNFQFPVSVSCPEKFLLKVSSVTNSTTITVSYLVISSSSVRQVTKFSIRGVSTESVFRLQTEYPT